MTVFPEASEPQVEEIPEVSGGETGLPGVKALMVPEQGG